MNWVLLVLAGLFEVCWATGMKASHGFTRLLPSLFTAVTLAFSMGLLAFAMRTLPVGTAYVVWTGVGAVGTAIVGMVAFGESAAFARIACLGLIVAGIVGLKLFSK